MPTTTDYCWTRPLPRQDNRPTGKSKIGRGFHPKKQR